MLVGGRYLLAEPVGEGGLGLVWRGHDQLLDRVVAVKEILLPPQSSDERADLVARTVREARAATLLDHPGAVTVYDVVEHDGAPWIVMRLISGPSLSAEIARLGRLPWSRAAEIGGQVARTLAAAHAAGLVHGDLKPDNILLSGRQATMINFGIARIIDAAPKRTSTGERAGTVHYLAPEQLEGGGAGPPADLWALGATLYAATEGRPPFDGPTTTATESAILTRAPAPAQHAGPLRELIEALLAKEPAERLDAQAVSSDLGGAIGATTGEPAKEVFAASQRIQLAPGSGEATGPVLLSRRRLLLLMLACLPFAAAAVAIVLALANLTGTPASSEPVTAAPAAALREPSGNSFSDMIEAMAFGPGGMLAEGDLSGNIFVWNTATRKITAALALPAHGRWVTTVAFGPSGTLAGGANGSTYLWNTTTKKLIATLHSPGEHGVNSVAWGPGGALAVGTNGATFLWDTTTRKLIATLHGPGDYFGVNSVAWGPGGTLATGDTNGSTYLWDTTTKKLIATLRAPGDLHEVESVAWGPGGVLAAGDRAEGGTYLWDTTTRKLIATLPDRYGVTSVAFGPGRMLAVGDPVDAWVWDTTTKRIATTLAAQHGTLTSVAFGPDSTLAVSFADGQIYLWHLSP